MDEQLYHTCTCIVNFLIIIGYFLVMGNVLYNNMLLGGSEKPLHLNHELQEKLAQLNGLKEKVKSITEREERHIDATYLYAQG